MIKELIEKRLNLIIEKILIERKDEISQKIDKEAREFELRKNTELNKLLEEKEILIKKVNEEKNRLSETLNIINQNLTAQDIWLRLWSVAFDKAMDICWDLTKDKTKKMIDLVKDKALDNLRKETDQILSEHNKKIEESLLNMDVNKMSILNVKKEAEKNYLIYNKSQNKERQEYFKGQLDLIERILNEKKN